MSELNPNIEAKNQEVNNEREGKNPAQRTPEDYKNFITNERHESIKDPVHKQEQIQAGLALQKEFINQPDKLITLNFLTLHTTYPLSSLANKISTGKSILNFYLQQVEKTNSREQIKNIIKWNDSSKQEKVLSYLTSGIEEKYTKAFSISKAEAKKNGTKPLIASIFTPAPFSLSPSDQPERHEANENSYKKRAELVADAEASKADAIAQHGLQIENPANLKDNEPAQQALAKKMGYKSEEFTNIKKKFETSKYNNLQKEDGSAFLFADFLSFLQRNLLLKIEDLQGFAADFFRLL